MKIKQVSYSMLRATKQFENDRVEFTVELEPGDQACDVVAKAKELCNQALDRCRTCGEGRAAHGCAPKKTGWY